MNCSSVVWDGTATISGRGFMASRTVFRAEFNYRLNQIAVACLNNAFFLPEVQ